MNVFKFGGASLKSAPAIRNMAAIVKANSGRPLVVVVSAMGKTTNALEALLALYRQGKPYQAELDALKSYHLNLAADLFTDKSILKGVSDYFELLTRQLKPGPEDQVYDQVVSMGELISSHIVHRFLVQSGIACALKDARQFILTDDCFREGKVNWETTRMNIQTLLPAVKNQILLTQGFIGSTAAGYTTTLGREGSDYTAAIFASCLDADSATIWKDVPGVMTADPKRIPGATVFTELPYKEAAEMTYYGASVIHPKTIKPLAVKGIPLYVKSFDNPELPGTIIHECRIENIPPLIVFKENQCLVSCRVTDYTFVNEQQLSLIFHALSELDIRINVMQNSAISFSFCIDYREHKLIALIERLRHHFDVFYNTNLVLITIKNYDEPTVEAYRKKTNLLLEQSSRSTFQVLVKP
ncbi:aspartate kinase [Oscillatoria amoena NRMC-F 0135]|nr:aspartate kinase [Oscillatoria amoena NRMC-F 0135]